MHSAANSQGTPYIDLPLKFGPLLELVIFEGEGADGMFGRLIKEGIRFDHNSQALITRRTWYRESPNGEEKVDQYISSQRPVAKAEVQGWLEKYGFEILKTMGSRKGAPYTPDSERAIFWARKL